MNNALKPVIFVAAAIYLAVDEIFSSIAHPIANWLSRQPVFALVRNWITSLGPYSSLALFLVPLVLLEPVKPVAMYLAATGYFAEGALVFVVGETLKLVLIERLFHLTRDRLMTIPAFAWCYARVRGVLDYLEALPMWKATKAKLAALKVFLRDFVRETFTSEHDEPTQSEVRERPQRLRRLMR